MQENRPKAAVVGAKTTRCTRKLHQCYGWPACCEVKNLRIFYGKDVIVPSIRRPDAMRSLCCSCSMILEAGERTQDSARAFALKWRNFCAQGNEISSQKCSQGQEEHNKPSRDPASHPFGEKSPKNHHSQNPIWRFFFPISSVVWLQRRHLLVVFARISGLSLLLE